MAKLRKNYFKKPVGSVAVLGYYCVVPFYNNSAKLTGLQKTSEIAESILLQSIEYACARMQASFIVGEELYDDGIVEMYPIVEETHVSVYMKLPATISVHSAISQMRIFSTKFLLQTELAEYSRTYNSLYSRKYLAMCEPVDTTGVKALVGTVYTQHIKAFFLENNLEGNPQNTHLSRERKFGKKPFMSEEVTFFK